MDMAVDLTYPLFMIFAVALCIIPQIQTYIPKKNLIIRLSIAGLAVIISAIIILVYLQPIASNGNETVYVTDTGAKYHLLNCFYLHSLNEVSLSDAVSSGYTACSKCDPPAYIPETYHRSFADLFDIKSLSFIGLFLLVIAAQFLLYWLLHIFIKHFKKKRKS